MADIFQQPGRTGEEERRNSVTPDETKLSRRQGMTHVRWWIIFLCFLATTINYIDRTNLAVAAPFMSKDLHINAALMGLVLSAFFWTYAIFQLPSGWFVDRFGPRISYTFACIWWSIMTGLVAVVSGFATLFGARLLLGAGEAPAYPTNAKVTSEWFPLRERGTATAIFDIGSKTGTAFALPLVAYIVGTYGWRASFVVTGLLGLIWTAIWYWYYRPLRNNRRVSQAERDYIEQGGARREEEAGATPVSPTANPLTDESTTRTAEVNQPQESITWGSLFRYRTVWGMMLGFFSLNFVIYFFITWFPTYLVSARHFSLLNLGLFGMIPPLCGVIGELLGGYVSDRLVRRGMSLTAARKIPIVIGMLLASVIALAVIVPSAGLALALLSLSYAAVVFAAPSIWAMPADVAPTSHYVASIGGIQNFASNIAGIVLPIYTGFVVQATNGSFVIPLMTAGAFAIIGALSYLFIVERIEPLKVKTA